jgi:hypothetical protein
VSLPFFLSETSEIRQRNGVSKAWLNFPTICLQASYDSNAKTFQAIFKICDNF